MAHNSQAASMRDETFGWEMRTWARLQARSGKSRVYLYYFSRVGPSAINRRLGAYHASEIRYVFDNLQNTPAEDTDREVARVMSSYWMRFATKGDPNQKGLPHWPSYTEKDDTAMLFGDHIQTTEVPNKKGLDFLDMWFEKQRQK
jgi:para-nitrobenzyl esterase